MSRGQQKKIQTDLNPGGGWGTHGQQGTGTKPWRSRGGTSIHSHWLSLYCHSAQLSSLLGFSGSVAPNEGSGPQKRTSAPGVGQLRRELVLLKEVTALTLWHPKEEECITEKMLGG